CVYFMLKFFLLQLDQVDSVSIPANYETHYKNNDQSSEPPGSPEWRRYDYLKFSGFLRPISFAVESLYPACIFTRIEICVRCIVRCAEMVPVIFKSFQHVRILFPFGIDVVQRSKPYGKHRLSV